MEYLLLLRIHPLPAAAQLHIVPLSCSLLKWRRIWLTSCTWDGAATRRTRFDQTRVTAGTWI